ncbi:MAG: hypothetical protein ACOH1Y_15840, partial [Propionicimonas sp.]
GAQVASAAGTHKPKGNAAGFLRGGWDTIPAGWPTPPTNAYFSGDLDEMSVYLKELAPDRIGAHFLSR